MPLNSPVKAVACWKNTNSDPTAYSSTRSRVNSATGLPAWTRAANETCDGLDNDCDGNPLATEVDLDGDGVFVCNGDCNDNDPNVQPGAPEVCDGLDGDCDGSLGPDEIDADLLGGLDCSEGRACPEEARFVPLGGLRLHGADRDRQLAGQPARWDHHRGAVGQGDPSALDPEGGGGGGQRGVVGWAFALVRGFGGGAGHQEQDEEEAHDSRFRLLRARRNLRCGPRATVRDP